MILSKAPVWELCFWEVVIAVTAREREMVKSKIISMVVEVRCDECGHVFGVSMESNSRRRIDCPACSARFEFDTWNTPREERQGVNASIKRPMQLMFLSIVAFVSIILALSIEALFMPLILFSLACVVVSGYLVIFGKN